MGGPLQLYRRMLGWVLGCLGGSWVDQDQDAWVGCLVGVGWVRMLGWDAWVGQNQDAWLGCLGGSWVGQNAWVGVF